MQTPKQSLACSRSAMVTRCLLSGATVDDGAAAVPTGDTPADTLDLGAPPKAPEAERSRGRKGDGGWGGIQYKKIVFLVEVCGFK